MNQKTKNEALGCLLGIALILVVLGIIAGIKIVPAIVLYGDWKCGFAQCRLTK